MHHVTLCELSILKAGNRQNCFMCSSRFEQILRTLKVYFRLLLLSREGK